MSKWTKVRDLARAAGLIGSIFGLKVKGVPVSEIKDAAEREGQHIADAVKEMKKDAKPKD